MPPKRRSGTGPREQETVQPTGLSQADVDRILAANEVLTEAVRALSRERNRSTVAASVSASLVQHHPPEFNGTGGPAVLEDWLRKFEKLFTTVGCPEEYKVDQAACYLTGRADLWWCDNQEMLRLYHKSGTNEEETFGWTSFRKAIRDEFFPEHQRHAKRTEFDNFKMTEGMTVEEYYVRFIELASFSTDLVLSNEALAARFEHGLALHILEKMPAGIPTTIRDMYLKAGHAHRLCDLRREKRKSEGGERDFRAKRGSYSAPSQGYKYGGASRSESATSPVSRGSYGGSESRGTGRGQECRRCSKVHTGRTCDGKLLTCFECGKLGHKSFECFRRTRGGGQGGTFRAPAYSSGSVAQGGGSQWRGGSGYSGGRGFGGSGSQFQKGGSNSQGGAGSSRGGYVGRGRGGFGGGARTTSSAPTVQEGVKSSGQLYTITREEAQRDDHVVTGAGSKSKEHVS
ncbi:hypothetical protein RND81_02G172100 [Saponaria officinalis]|uniref:CCHC-type domain-containing protein n=1 Tax=Saponaria officinalis TaxID=3572 RepID=A0AAW1MXU1_SAPOF